MNVELNKENENIDVSFLSSSISTLKDMSSQTENVYDSNTLNDQMKKQNDLITLLQLKTKYCLVSQDKELFTHYTGITIDVFHCLTNFLKSFELNYYFSSKVECLCIEDQLLLSLMKLRHNFTLMDLGFRFGISTTTASSIFLTLIYAIHEFIYPSMRDHIPSRGKCAKSSPVCFKNFSNARIILDCTEIFIDRQRNDLLAQKLTYSHYKGCNTFKALIGVAPNGAIIYCSNLFSGCISDKQIVAKSDVLSHLTAGDLIIADKGFLISDILPPGVSINILAFVPSDSKQFSEDQVIRSKEISRAWIHVEHAIESINQYSILDKISYQYRKHASKFLQVAVILVNMQILS